LQAKGDLRNDNFSAVGEFLMNYFGAVETTTATLGFAIDRLGAHPVAQADLAAEIFENRASLRLECFINETLRYFPPIPILTRRLASDAEFEDLKLKKGSVIIISIIGIHQHPEYWTKPNFFDCERVEFLKNTYDRRAFIPFASGTRSCGGARLAKLELVEGLKAFIRRFIVAREGGEIAFDYAMTMRPNSWGRLTITTR
jgi:cytochrome P450